MTTGSDISSADYVTIQNKAELLLGTGSGSRGYGQTIQSSDVFTGNTITKAQWDALRYDIVNIKYHQDGEIPNIVTVNVGDLIGYGAASPNTNYNTILESAITNRFKLSPSQAVLTTVGTATRTTSWSNSASCELTATFSNAAQARYFFNAGGQIRTTFTLSGGSATSQMSAWKNILNAVGTQTFGAVTSTSVGYYNLTNSYQTYFQQALSTPYSANNVKLEAKVNVSDNSLGTATSLNIRITLTDGYVDSGASPPPDLVDGTLEISLQELKASGTLIPTGTFSITSPTYSLSSITAS